MRPTNRLIGLDLLRLLAVLLVFFRHSRPPVATFMSVGGWVGVDIFFVLSGFLVSGLVFKEYQLLGTFHPWKFLARRGFKIYPAFYCFIGVTVCLGLVTPSRNQLMSDLFFVQSYFPPIQIHTWSLAVEEHFYLLLTLVFYAMTRGKAGTGNPFRLIPSLSVGLACICL